MSAIIGVGIGVLFPAAAVYVTVKVQDYLNMRDQQRDQQKRLEKSWRASIKLPPNLPFTPL